MKGVIDDIKVQAVTEREQKRAWWSLWLYKREVKKSLWKLLEDFEYFGIIVPCGFIFDFASIPKMLHSWINPIEAGIRSASLCHDWLYNKRGLIDVPLAYIGVFKFHFSKLIAQGEINYISYVPGGAKFQLSRKACDKIFLEIMKLCEFDVVKRRAAYRGVRLGGWVAWNKKD